MTTLTRRVLDQPFIGIAAATLAVGLLASTRVLLISELEMGGYTYVLGLALLLGASVVLAGLYPIHVRLSTKITMTTVPLFLIAVLLPPTTAAWTAGLAILVERCAKRKKMSLLPGDIATAAGRWTIVAWLASQVGHLTLPGTYADSLMLLAAALVMLIGDIVTSAFEVAPMTGEPIWHVVVSLSRETLLVEAVQYLVGILGALSAVYHAWSLVLLFIPIAVVHFVFKSMKEMQDNTRALLEKMADSVDLRDPYTGGHSRRITEMCRSTLREMGVSGQEAELIRVAARVHDIGKIEIPDHVLTKIEPLNEEEWAIIKLHPDHGVEILTRYPGFTRGADIVRSHHERWDGQGYPRGLRGLDIPLGARVIAVADAFDAMTVDRPYRHALPPDQAILVLRAGAGRQWDPSVVDSFLRVVGRKGTSAATTPSPNVIGTAPASN